MKEKKLSMSYVTNIFASSNCLLVIYETNSIFRIQSYSTDGKFLNESEILGNPGKGIWFDKAKSILYSISKKSNAQDGYFMILKYNIKW